MGSLDDIMNVVVWIFLEILSGVQPLLEMSTFYQSIHNVSFNFI